MKLYHIKENLSMVLAVILCGDAYGCLYIFGEHMIYGTPIRGWLLLPVVILAAFAVAALVCAAVRIVRYLRAPRRLGVIGSEVICKSMEGKKMLYEIIKGHPSDRQCEIGAYENNELMATYRGFYDRRRCSWTLYPLRRYALSLGAEFKKITLSERDVHLPRPKMEVKPVVAAKTEAKDAPKQKHWRYLPDPEGQMKMV